MRKLSNNEFLNRCIEVHGNLYDYTKTNYVNSRTNVIIICSLHGEFKTSPATHLSRCLCPSCYKENLKSNKTSFIEKANIIHRNKYNYDIINYINNYTDVNIICPIHGEFLINPRSHIRNKTGCRKCAKEEKLKALIEKIKKYRDSEYDYSNTKFVNDQYKLISINCFIHGEFIQSADSHIYNKASCPKCSNRERVTFGKFVLRSNIIHNNKYKYDESSYSNTYNECKILCANHSWFMQKPENHLKGHGCPNCSKTKKSNTFLFTKKAEKIHNYKYDYSYVKYKNAKIKVKINCLDHGEFLQTPSDHLSGSGCPKCSTNISNKELKWLKSLNIQLDFQKPIRCNGKLIKVDGFDIRTNTIYEFYGDFWHGNPKIYNSDDFNCVNKKTFGELYSKTLEREFKLKKLGYSIISIWESDFVEHNVI